MIGKILLDTNIVIAVFEEDPFIKTSLLDAEQIFIPSIVLGELYYGAFKSSNFE